MLKFVYNKRYLLTLNSYGVSGSRKEVLEYMGFDIGTLVEKCEKLLK